MKDPVQIRAGKLNGRKEMPKLAVNEIAYQTEEKALYIGTPQGNVKLGGITDEEKQEIINEAVAKALAEFEKLTAEA